MDWSRNPIPIPKIDQIKFNAIKPEQVSSINTSTTLVRFFEYNKKRCWIDRLEKWQLKSLVSLIKEITENWLPHQYTTCTWKYIDLSSPDEYSKLMKKYEHTEGVLEFSIWGKARVFWFFIWSYWETAPTFNVVLITSSENHLDTKKNKK